MAENPYESSRAMDNAATSPIKNSSRPPLFSDKSFWGMTSTQFLGAFNDNLFKQLALLLAVRGAVQGVGGKDGAQDIQGLAMIFFSAPFLFFSGYAGFISERNSKRAVIVACKFAEIAIVLLGMAAFLLWDMAGMAGILFVLFLMGTHSAFFGPGKYGVLPELFDENDLPQANGIILMTTFLAIIFGTALAGWLKTFFGEQRLWQASLVCLGIAVVGTQTALLIRKVPPANPKLQFTPGALLVPGEILALFRGDSILLRTLLAYCMFWFVGGLVQPAVNALGKIQFQVTDDETSYLAACMGIGIAIGAVIAGTLSHRGTNFFLTKIGAWLIVVSLAAIALPGPGKENLLGYYGTGAALVFLGFAAGLFAVPLQVFLQARPPESLKGRTIATMNLSTWIAIVVSAVVYQLFVFMIDSLAWPRAASFAFTAAIMLPVALFFRPSDKE